MESVNITNAQKDLYNLVLRANETHKAVQINGQKANAILIAEDDWKAIQETLFLSSIPGMASSLRDAAREPLSEGVNSEELDWNV